MPPHARVVWHIDEPAFKARLFAALEGGADGSVAPPGGAG
jgi:hypothetical protein